MTPLSRPELEELERLTNRALRYTEEHPDEADDLDLPEWPTELLQFVEATSPENVAALLESASFAERALELLRSMDQVAKETDDCPCCATLRVYPNFPNTDNCETEHEPGCALAELLRSLPAEPAKEKPDAT